MASAQFLLVADAMSLLSFIHRASDRKTLSVTRMITHRDGRLSTQLREFTNS
jgi:hypothetical protein